MKEGGGGQKISKIFVTSFMDVILKPTIKFNLVQGDSGSSLQYEFRQGLWIQEGIVSFGSSTGCGTSPPSGYSRISFYLDFIGNATGIVMK